MPSVCLVPGVWKSECVCVRVCLRTLKTKTATVTRKRWNEIPSRKKKRQQNKTILCEEAIIRNIILFASLTDFFFIKSSSQSKYIKTQSCACQINHSHHRHHHHHQSISLALQLWRVCNFKCDILSLLYVFSFCPENTQRSFKRSHIVHTKRCTPNRFERSNRCLGCSCMYVYSCAECWELHLYTCTNLYYILNQRWMKTKGNPWKDLPFFSQYWCAVERKT